MFKYLVILTSCILLFKNSNAQTEEKRVKGILFPTPMYDKKWCSSIGFINITTPEDLTEEVQVRAPLGDWQVLRNIKGGFYASGRLQFQIVQNNLSIGIRYAKKINDNWYVSIGDEISYWRGKVTSGGFDSKGRGTFNTPNLSVGYKFNQNYLLTFRTDVSINTSSKFINGDNEIKTRTNKYNGISWTLGIEQPFYKEKHLTLAFTGMYSDFYWPTWPLFDTFERFIFYPLITVGFIL